MNIKDKYRLAPNSGILSGLVTTGTEEYEKNNIEFSEIRYAEFKGSIRVFFIHTIIKR